MEYLYERDDKLRVYNQTHELVRQLNTKDIYVPPGYQIEIFAVGLNSPIGMTFSEKGDLYVADSGFSSGKPQIFKYDKDHFETYADGFIKPITGISSLDDNIYVSHKNYISVIYPNGKRENILSGLPCNGDYGISNVTFGPEGKIYFGLGTATNSGVVGSDNRWVYEHPLLHDVPGVDIKLVGQNFDMEDMLIPGGEKISTGAFSAYGVPNNENEIKKGVLKSSGSILRAYRDGSQLEMVAWGFRSPIRVKFDKEYRLLVANRGCDVRGSRPIANAPDELQYVAPGVWYGWPDYCAGEPVTSPQFKPEGRKQPEFLLAEHPNVPPKPFAVFQPHSSILGFDINYNKEFGYYGDVFIAEYGSLGPSTMGPSAPYIGIGHRISRVDMKTQEISTFASNKSGLPAMNMQDSGFGRLVDVVFGPDGAMYILEIGINDPYDVNKYIPNTGVIWKITRTKPIESNIIEQMDYLDYDKCQ